MRLLSVFMSRTKSGSKSSSEVCFTIHSKLNVCCITLIQRWQRTFIFLLFYFLNVLNILSGVMNCVFLKTNIPVILSFSLHHWFPMPQPQPCSALVPLTIVSMCSNHSWSSGRASRVKKSLWPPASFSAHTQHPPHQTWVLFSFGNMSRYHIRGGKYGRRKYILCIGQEYWFYENSTVF